MLEQFGLVQTNIKAVKVGDVFGRLEVKAVGQVANTYRYYAVCQCKCGSELKRIRVDGLRNGAVVGCGCIQKERTTKHGLTGSDHLKRWSHMMDRCYNEKCASYKDYGGRGISVCDAWHDVTQYVADLPKGYKKGMQVDRIDNDGNYEPGNIRWATRKVNSGNRRSCRLVEFNGETKLMSRWAEDLGISLSSLTARIDKLGWPIEKALTEPACDPHENILRAQRISWEGHVKKPKPEPRVLKTVEWQGRRFTVAELSEMTGVSKPLLRKQLFERSWPIEKVMANAKRKRDGRHSKDAA